MRTGQDMTDADARRHVVITIKDAFMAIDAQVVDIEDAIESLADPAMRACVTDHMADALIAMTAILDMVGPIPGLTKSGPVGYDPDN